MLICPNAINSDRCGRQDCPLCGTPRYQDGDSDGAPNFVVHPDLAHAMGWQDGQIADVPVMVHEGHVITRPARIVIQHKIPEIKAPRSKIPRPPPGTAVQASDRSYQVGLAGEYRRVTPKPLGKKRRKESR
jgi:hypothetical protein